MATLKKFKVKTEKELHSIIQREIDALEEGLKVLEYEPNLGKIIPDFLCVDSGDRLVIIEVKLQEDENILFQALRYYNEIDKDRYAIAKMYPKQKIDPKEHPRIVLIAERFSDDLRRLCTLIIPDVELYEYSLLLTPDNKVGICYHFVSLPKIEEILTEPMTIEDLRNYIKKDDLKTKFDEVRKDVKAIGNNIEDYAAHNYVGFKYKGKQIAQLDSFRKLFVLWVIIKDENAHIIGYESVTIENGDENYEGIIDKIRETYINIGGKVK